MFETVTCLRAALVGAFFIDAEDDLTGQARTLHSSSVRRVRPRLSGAAADARAHQAVLRRRVHRASGEPALGPARAALHAAMGALDRAKLRIVRRYIVARRPSSACSTSGCGSGRVPPRVRRDDRRQRRRRRLRRSVGATRRSTASSSTTACSTTRRSGATGSTSSRCGTSSSTTTTRCARSRTRATALKPGGTLVIEVPRLDSLSFRLFRDRWPGLQAPQHTALYDRERLARSRRDARASRSSSTCRTARFRRTSTCSAAWRFALLRGRGLNLRRAIYAVLRRPGPAAPRAAAPATHSTSPCRPSSAGGAHDVDSRRAPMARRASLDRSLSGVLIT